MIWTLFGVTFVIYWIWGRSLGEPPMYPGELPIIGHMYRFFVDNTDITMILILFCIILALYWVWQSLPGEPPMLPGALPIIGHLHHAVNNIDVLDCTKKMSKFCYDHGGIAKLKIGFRTVYAVADPDDCYTIANTCLHKHEVYFLGKKFLGESLFLGKLSVWKRHRKLLNPAFNQQVLDNFMDIFNEQARKLVSDISKEDRKEPFKHFKYMRRNALESICLTTMDVNLSEISALNDQYENALEKMHSIIMERILKPWLYIGKVYEMSDLKKKEDEVVNILHEFSDSVLQRKKAKRQAAENNGDKKKKEKFKPFIDLLLDFENGIFTDQEIREEVDNMIVTGHDTTASTLTIVLLLIGTYPEVQDRIVEEINTVFNNTENDVEKHDLHKLVYLEAVLKESMRLYPIGPIIGRWSDKKVKLKNYTLPANSEYLLLAQGINCHPVWGPDAEEFKPERWLSAETLPKNSNTFMSFSIGKRNCFGKAYAMMTMKTTVVHFLRRYRITADCTKAVFKVNVLLKVDSGGEISIKSRI